MTSQPLTPDAPHFPAWATFTARLIATMTALVAVFAGIPALVDIGGHAVLIAFFLLVAALILVDRWTA